MNKTLVVSLVALLFSSCDPMNDDTYVKISITNNTDKDFLVYCEYPVSIAIYKIQSGITSQMRDAVIFDKLVRKDGSGEYFSYFNIWVYNTSDSTYCILGENGNYAKNTQWNYILGQYYSYTLNHENPEEYRGNYSFVIDESLLPKMLKNTHLTDSVFGLKNK